MRVSEGYEEEHDLVVAGGRDESDDGDEEDEDAHGDHPTDDVDAGDGAIAFPPRCHGDEEQAHQLGMEPRALWTYKHTYIHTYMCVCVCVKCSKIFTNLITEILHSYMVRK